MGFSLRSLLNKVKHKLRLSVLEDIIDLLVDKISTFQANLTISQPRINLYLRCYF